MAEAVVSFVAEKLYNLLKEEAVFLLGVDNQVNLLERELRQMQAFLRVADSMAIKNDNISNYLKDVRDAAYDAEDIVDNYILRMHRPRRREGRSLRGFIKLWLQQLVLRGRLKLWVDDHNSSNHPPAYGSDEMPPNLNELVLEYSGLQHDPFLLLEKLPYLRRLVLESDAFRGTGGGEAVCCSAGGFPQLEELELWRVSFLRRWTVEGGALPRLRRLVIDECDQLEMLPDGLQHLNTLQTLGITSMPEEFVRRLRKGGEDWHKIQHIPHLTID